MVAEIEGYCAANRQFNEASGIAERVKVINGLERAIISGYQGQ